MVLKEINDLSDEGVVGSLHFDTRYQYALWTENCDEQQASMNTISNFRKRLLMEDFNMLKKVFYILGFILLVLLTSCKSNSSIDSLENTPNFKTNNTFKVVYTVFDDEPNWLDAVIVTDDNDNLITLKESNIDKIQVDMNKAGSFYVIYHINGNSGQFYEYRLKIIVNNPAYTINFVTNSWEYIHSITQFADKDITIPTLERRGYTFLGWYTDITLTKQFDSLKMPFQDITLYASWQINDYTITFNSNGGSEIAPMKLAAFADNDIPLPVKEGYSFLGWFSNVELTNGVYTTESLAEDVTLYAKWIDNDLTVTFADKNLEQAIKENLGIDNLVYNRPIFKEEAYNQTSLNLSDHNITNLDGLQYFPNLESLCLDNNQITDITVLSSLTKLIALRLSDNNIVNLAPLANLNELWILRLDYNKIIDISPMGVHLKLEFLRLNHNPIDLRVGTNSYYTYLNMQRSNVDIDVSVIVEDPNAIVINFPDGNLETALRDYLGIYYRPITQDDAKNVEVLHLENKNITKLEGLQNFINLSWLNLQNNQIDDISNLTNLTKLFELNLNDNQISDITSLRNLNNLYRVELRNNYITEINSLEMAFHLRYLDVKNNQVSDISVLKTLYDNGAFQDYTNTIYLNDNLLNLQMDGTTYNVIMYFDNKNVSIDIRYLLNN